jgi:hypothetical protein
MTFPAVTKVPRAAFRQGSGQVCLIVKRRRANFQHPPADAHQALPALPLRFGANRSAFHSKTAENSDPLYPMPQFPAAAPFKPQ